MSNRSDNVIRKTHFNQPAEEVPVHAYPPKTQNFLNAQLDGDLKQKIVWEQQHGEQALIPMWVISRYLYEVILEPCWRPSGHFTARMQTISGVCPVQIHPNTLTISPSHPCTESHSPPFSLNQVNFARRLANPWKLFEFIACHYCDQSVTAPLRQLHHSILCNIIKRKVISLP